jgi:hypothetical protein
LLEWAIRIMGLSQVGVALMHLGFPRRFQWQKELPKLSLLNKQMFEVHTLFVALSVALMGCIALFFPSALLEKSQLAPLVWIASLLFWAVRWFAQFFIYSPQLWRGNRLNTIAHIAFALLWTFYVSVAMFALHHHWHNSTFLLLSFSELYVNDSLYLLIEL